MSKANLLEIARRTALEPWSSVDEKLGALAGLESIATLEAMEALVEVMSLTGLYSKPSDKGDLKFPRNGEVAGAAARALARIELPSGERGVSFLAQLAKASGSSEDLRECAIYGLGGGTGKDVFECYGELLNSREMPLLERLYRSIAESYKRIDCESSPHASVFLVTLFDATSRLMDEGGPTSLVSRAAIIIASALPERGRAEIFNLAHTPKNGTAAKFAVEVLCHLTKPVPLGELVGVLRVPGFSGDVYESVGRRLALQTREKIASLLADAERGPRGFKGLLLKVSEAARVNELIRQRVIRELTQR